MIRHTLRNIAYLSVAPLLATTLAISSNPVSATPSGLHAGEMRVCPFVNQVEYLDLLRDEIITFYEISDTLPLVYSQEYRDGLIDNCRENLE